ncbi:MAG: glucosyl-3-phosphoglycerate synthase [Gordonia sp. (in: high G+C Gram-positive bacteria)]|uniref:glucosyl-3-phosphoglycerate synthase n=1 Tax=Gordonia sp. (in: high G+C Gram-positive bacteria) TaxID=84139 RepID=UPI0039E68218
MSGVPAVPGATIATWDRPTWTVDELVAAKGGRTIAVVLPALNEADTVAGVVDSIKPLLGSLVDDLVVLDSGSTDATAAQARAAGARVVSREEALPQVPPVDGKGEVLWRSIAATTADILVFIDSDLVAPDPMFVPKLVGPILTKPAIELVKGYYRRPWRTAAQHVEDGGGRVTELVARPLLAALRPELSHVVQPLGGEYAGTRELLSSLPFAPGYGVEIGLLIDTLEARGPQAIGQVNLGVRMHRHRPLTELGVMSRQIVGTLLRRCGIDDSQAPLVQFAAAADGSFATQVTETVLTDRPPMNSVQPKGDRR